MVYSGYPSKACAECRLRRTKCDTLKPSCSQCIRAGRKCRGYRDLSDLMFRDESQGQVVKHQRRKEAKAKARLQEPRPKAVATASTSIPKGSLQEVQTNILRSVPSSIPLISPGLAMSPEDQATCYFFHNYVLEQEQFVRGNFQYLREVYNGENVGIGLSDSVAALGMAGMAHFWKSPNIMANAQMKYNSALRQVSTQLRNAEGAKSDKTLIAVMLLGLYETNTCNSRQSMESWTKHISGAAALLHFRGKRQLQTSIGRHLFVHLRTQVVTNCIQRHVTVPPSISEWSKALESETNEEAAATELSEFAIKYCNLRASMKSFHDFSNPGFIILAACALDAEYVDWASRCPFQYIYSTVTLKERSDEVFSDHYHVYSNIWIATIWNHYRSVRILLNELILDQIYHIYPFNADNALVWENPSFFENQLLSSNAILLQLSHEICSSVPYFLGYDPESKAAFSSPKAVNGNLLLWPLYTAACTDMVSDMMRNWVAGRLRWISETMGIRQAGPLAHTLSVHQDLLDWNGGEIDGVGTTVLLPNKK